QSDCGLFLLSAAVSLAGAATLEQHPRELSVQEGGRVTFQCSMKGDTMRYYWMYWYRQGPRGSLDFIYRRGDRYGEGFQDRFMGIVESSKNSFTL
ncbi:HVM09 protein, partial [Certhia brachydactyla]|nr:HVM09 protein [Certhia brachydactyla]